MTAPVLAPGAVVAGRYQIGAVLAQGGSSNTYYCRAQDGREVAVKVFDPAIRQRTDVMQLVEQIYGITNTMPADLVARIVDAGYDPVTQAPFGVTERVPLPSLAQTIAQRTLSPEEALAMLRALARVLDTAHAAKLMHHALKPTNVFVGFGQQAQIRVADFGAGLARIAVPTQEGYAGSAPWLAPEQAQQGMQPGAAADVFAAALLVFYAMTGRPYWRSCQGAAPDLAMWQQELVGPREPASMRAGQLGVSLNRAFDPVLGCALSVDPSQRYRSVGELAAAMESLVASKGPESSHTVAFPVSGGGDYPPPPAPLGGGGGAAALGGYAMSQAPPLGGPTLASASGGVPQPGTGLPPPVPRSTGARLAPIVVGIAAVVLVGGAVFAVVFMGKKKPVDDGPVAVATTASATPDSSAGAAASASPSAGASAAASAEPSASASAEPATSGSPDAAAAPVEVALTCDPECDEIKVDDKPIDDRTKPLMLTPGKHKVVVTKEKYYPQNDLITVEAGAKFEKAYHLVAAAKAAPKPCGKFLKHNCN
jgi:hypothetical protein